MRQAEVRDDVELHALEQPNRLAIFATETDFRARQRSAFFEIANEFLALARIVIKRRRVVLHEIFARVVSENVREGVVALEDAAVDRVAINAVEMKELLDQPRRMIDGRAQLYEIRRGYELGHAGAA